MPHSFLNRLLLALSITTVTSLGTIDLAQADFLQTMASGVYQNISGHVKVVLSNAPGAQGLFVMAGPPIAPQEFNLENSPTDGYTHLFIRFSEDTEPPSYSHVEIKGKSYKISGNLTLSMAGLATINIDNNNPYLTVVTEGAAARGKPDIIGFSGITEVVRAGGSAVAILAANQLDTDVAQVIKPYSVQGEDILLNGNPVKTPTIGTFIRPDSDCLKPGTTVLTNIQVLQVQSTKVEAERLKILGAALKESQKNSPLKGHLVLKADKKSVVLLSVLDKDIKEMHPIKNGTTRKPVCVISEITLE